MPSSYIHHNKEYLSNTDNTIQEISRIIGYNDEFTFSKAFKKYSGFSPKIYRQNLPK
ncbi:helix-turn-helix domain-containing protein [Lactobacillus helveticus]|uniref:helix-turn-helix domain-containing protein n=1 Tax=Lactobacillus helveticus TaxID=1587 RepID=UPI0027D9EECB|nr:helix-turn-helix domain-containing protein [Lactobacillus helveticus]